MAWDGRIALCLSVATLATGDGTAAVSREPVPSSAVFPASCGADAMHRVPWRDIVAAARGRLVSLALGVETGMSRAQVRAINPMLLRNEPVGEFDLFGPPLKANVEFDGHPEAAVALAALGFAHQAEVISALTARYGAPVDLGGRVDTIDGPIGMRSAPRPIEIMTLKWCDGDREYLLEGEPGRFSLLIYAAPR